MRLHLVVVVALLISPPLVAAQDVPDAPGWPDGEYNPFGHSPIRVRLDLSNLTDEVRAYEREILAAFTYWEQGGNGALRWQVVFEFVEEDPDIVFWLRDAPRVGPYCGESERALGCARPFDRPVGIEMVTRLDNDSFRPYRQIREVAMHELGHALGLPHSSDPNDIMAAHVSHRASTSWRPGDWGRLAKGSAYLFGIGVVSVVFLWWALRAPPPEYAIEPLADPPETCPSGPDGLHDLVPAEVRTRQGQERWLVCRHCRRGRPAS